MSHVLCDNQLMPENLGLLSRRLDVLKATGHGWLSWGFHGGLRASGLLCHNGLLSSPLWKEVPGVLVYNAQVYFFSPFGSFFKSFLLSLYASAF